jgi:hypothetical protein
MAKITNAGVVSSGEIISSSAGAMTNSISATSIPHGYIYKTSGTGYSTGWVAPPVHAVMPDPEPEPEPEKAPADLFDKEVPVTSLTFDDIGRKVTVTGATGRTMVKGLLVEVSFRSGNGSVIVIYKDNGEMDARVFSSGSKYTVIFEDGA